MARAGSSILPGGPRGGASGSRNGSSSNAGFGAQEDFISFKSLFGEDEERIPQASRGGHTSGLGEGGRGRGEALAAGGRRGTKRSIGEVLEVLDEKGKSRLKDVEKTT